MSDAELQRCCRNRSQLLRPRVARAQAADRRGAPAARARRGHDGDGVNDAPASGAQTSRGHGDHRHDVSKEAATWCSSTTTSPPSSPPSRKPGGLRQPAPLRHVLGLGQPGQGDRRGRLALIGLVAMLKRSRSWSATCSRTGCWPRMGMEAAERNTMSGRRTRQAKACSPAHRSAHCHHRSDHRPAAARARLLQWRLLGLPNLLTIDDEAVRIQIASSPEVLSGAR